MACRIGRPKPWQPPSYRDAGAVPDQLLATPPAWSPFEGGVEQLLQTRVVLRAMEPMLGDTEEPIMFPGEPRIPEKTSNAS